MVMHLSMFMMSLRLSRVGISLSWIAQISDPLSSLGSRTDKTVSSNGLSLLVMLVSDVITHLYLDVFIIKLFYLANGSIATELRKAGRI